MLGRGEGEGERGGGMLPYDLPCEQQLPCTSMVEYEQTMGFELAILFLLRYRGLDQRDLGPVPNNFILADTVFQSYQQN